MENQENHNNGRNGNSTDTFVRDIAEDPALQDMTKKHDSHDHGVGSDQNGHHDQYTGETNVRDAVDSATLSNATKKVEPPKKYSFSVDAPPFVPSGARKQAAEALLEPVESVRDVTAPDFSHTVSGHISKISGAGEHFREELRNMRMGIPEYPAGDAGGVIAQSDAPLATESHSDGGDNLTSLEEKLGSGPPENEGILEDCPAPYVVPVPAEEQIAEKSPEGETVVRDTDATTLTHVVEDVIAEIHDSSSVALEWLDVLGNGAVMKKAVRKGQTGTRPVRSSVVTVRTSAEVLTSDLEADAMLKVVDKHDALRFTVGDLEVIQGLELAVQLMDIGEVAEVKFAPKFAYGEMGQPESGIPADAVLLYTVELLTVEPSQDMENLTVSERVLIANHKVDRGNFWYHRKEPTLALSLYQRAVSILEAPSERYISPEDTVQLNSAKARAYGNLSSAQVEERVWDEGLRSVNFALRYDPNNGKLWLRKIKIFREKGEIEEAVTACEDVLQKGALVAELFQQKARDELNTLRKKKRQANDKEKALYQRMLGSQSKLPGTGSSRSSPQPEDAAAAAANRRLDAAANPNRKFVFLGAAAAVAIIGVVIGLRLYQAHR